MKAVLDIGKTNIKLQLVDESGQPCDSYSRRNIPVNTAPYPHADIAGIWQWLTETLTSLVQADQITALIVTTHGATAALITNETGEGEIDDGLALPVLDYEFSAIDECNIFYNSARPDFTETFSPDLPAGLNLGRQIFWQQNKFSHQFARVTHILMYPQYWGWRLTGEVAGEVTSLGCHTDLWSPKTHQYSTLVERCHWQTLLPPLKSAWEALGFITPAVARKTGLSTDCKVYVGLHDSNASYLRYLPNSHLSNEIFTVVSTGTWTIAMQRRGDMAALGRSRDTLANCDVYGDPIACARFMGGREYEAICQQLGGDIQASITQREVQAALDHLWMVTPDFSSGNGPFGGLTPVIQCPLPAISAGAIASLYCALMIDQRLNDLQATGAIYIEGAFLKNALLCKLVAQLRCNQPVYLSADDTGTVQGALLLADLAADAIPGPVARPVNSARLALEICEPAGVSGLKEYRARWYELIAQEIANR